MPVTAMTVTARRSRAAYARGGRHRRRPSRSRARRAFDVSCTAGSLVTLGALLVLAVVAGGLVDGVSAEALPTVTVTFDSSH